MFQQFQTINPFFNPSLPVPERTHSGPAMNAYEFITVTPYFQSWLKQHKPTQIMEFVSQGLTYCNDNKRYFIQPRKDIEDGVNRNLNPESNLVRAI